MGLGQDPVVTAAVMAGSVLAVLFTSGMSGVDDVNVTPSTVRPGQSVSITADSCGVPATAYSAAFSATSARLSHRAHAMQGAARISPHAAPGTYAITIRCVRGGPYNGTFVVGEAHPTGTPNTGGGGVAMTVADHTTRTAWLFGALSATVTVLGASFVLARERRKRADH
ncbi:hypothetical protein ACQPYK_06115 [Streptosporangium sp. CA-135522]|uniref:hypothetical protein n=1 Tax=Streptosporangium sp. CA-135522 TaxID=3240072 RepID=UPI003D8A91DB